MNIYNKYMKDIQEEIYYKKKYITRRNILQEEIYYKKKYLW